jgi:hypothetical protein
MGLVAVYRALLCHNTEDGKHQMKEGFFPPSQVKNEAADAPWRKSEMDRMLDLYFNGAHPDRIAHELKRNPKAVKRRLEQFTYNERSWAERYEPYNRVSRKGKRFTQNETLIIKAHQERDVPVAATARLLSRSLEELTLEVPMELARCKAVHVAPTLDVIWAHRWLYFLRKTPIISDAAYDALVQEEVEYSGSAAFERIKLFRNFGPGYIRDLALYMHGKYQAQLERITGA